MTDFKTVTCCVTEVLLFIDIKRGKDNTKNRNYLRQLGTKEAYKRRMMESAKGIDQRYIKRGYKGSFYF